MAKKKQLQVDIVIPVYNESGVVEKIYKRLRDATHSLPHQFVFYYVDDGSTDDTVKELSALAEKDERVRILELSRNFGHQAALTAGMDAAQGDIIVTMDGDGQHPPEMIPQILNLVAQGYDIVQMQRIDDQPLSFKKWSSQFFYRMINLVSGTRIMEGAADFRALSRDALDGLRSMREYHRFLRGMISWMGYQSVILPFHEPVRVAGKTKYSMGKMLRLASDAVFSFSLAPLYIGLSAGLAFLFLAAAQLIYVAGLWVTGRTERVVPGWSSTMAILLISGGIIMILLGFIGVYVGYIFQEVKHRPIYLIKGKDSEDGK